MIFRTISTFLNDIVLICDRHHPGWNLTFLEPQMKRIKNLFSKTKNDEKDVQIAELKSLIKKKNDEDEKKLNEKEDTLFAAMKEFSKYFQISLKTFIQRMDNFYLHHEPLSPNQEAMLRRSWLLAHFGVVFSDLVHMDVLSQHLHAQNVSIPSEVPLLSISQDAFYLDPEAINNINRLISFYQVSNCGQPEANVIILWNNLFMNLLNEIQRARNIDRSGNVLLSRKKLIMESEYSFEQLKDINLPVIADLVLKGLDATDVPVCVIEYGAYPLNHYLHHKDVTKMGVMLSSILLHRYNEQNISAENLNNLEVYGILVEDFDFEFCVAKLRVNRNKLFIVDFSCGSGSYRFNIFDGQLDTSFLFRARHTEADQEANSSDFIEPSSTEISREIESQILHVPVEEASKSKIRKESMHKRTLSRSPNSVSMNILINFLVRVIEQNELVASFPHRPSGSNRKKFIMNSIFSKLIYSDRPAASINLPSKVRKARSQVVTRKEKKVIDSRPNMYIIAAKKESHFYGYEHYEITLDDNIMTFAEYMAQEQYDLDDPSLFIICQLDLIRDLVFATYNTHQSGYASLTYSKTSIFWGGNYMFGKFDTLQLLSETKAKKFSDLKREDYVNLADFVDNTYRFVSVLFSEFVPERFESEFYKVITMFDILRYSRKSEAEIVALIYEIYNEIRDALLIRDPYNRSLGHLMAAFQYDKLKTQSKGPIQIENIEELKKMSSHVIQGKTFDYSSESSEPESSESDSESESSNSESASSTYEALQSISNLELGPSSSSKIQEMHSSPSMFQRPAPAAQSASSKSKRSKNSPK